MNRFIVLGLLCASFQTIVLAFQASNFFRDRSLSNGILMAYTILVAIVLWVLFSTMVAADRKMKRV